MIVQCKLSTEDEAYIHEWELPVEWSNTRLQVGKHDFLPRDLFLNKYGGTVVIKCQVKITLEPVAVQPVDTIRNVLGLAETIYSFFSSLFPNFRHLMIPLQSPLSERELKTFSYPSRFFASTKIVSKSRFFIWQMDQSLLFGNATKQVIPVSYRDATLMILLSRKRKRYEDYLGVQLTLRDLRTIEEIEVTTRIVLPLLVTGKVQIIDHAGNIIASINDEHFFEEHEIRLGDEMDWSLESSFNVKDLIKKVSSLEKKELKFYFEFVFSNGALLSEMVLETNCRPRGPYNFEDESRSISNEISNLNEKDTLFDVVVRSKVKTYNAHKNVLCDMSPTFRAMFTCGMKESNSNVVDIIDLEDEIVGEMIWFMHTGKLEPTDFQKAVELYSAADKYQITSMLKICRNYFTDNISIQNLCPLLSVVYLRHDRELIDFLLKYVYINKNEILLSSEWTDFTLKDPALACEILKYICLKLPFGNADVVLYENKVGKFLIQWGN